MAITNVTELDFDAIKASLKTHLKSQARFKDYDFEGSNMSVLLDVLAYNTYQNNFYANMAFSEMFLDSAQLKDSVISHAKELNYLPRSRVSSNAKINLAFTVSNPQPSSITIPAKTKFIARCGNQTFNFYNATAQVVYPVNAQFNFYGLDIYEGTYVTEAYEVTNAATQRFVLSNTNIDINSIKVTVKNTVTDTASTEYIYKTNIFGVTNTDHVYYVQPAFDDKYEITFGKDRFGKSPINGNVVIIEYRVTAGSEANGITSFAPASTIDGYQATVTLNEKSANGSDAEDIESIRFFAPKAAQVQDRAVTESDYEVLLKTRFPEIQATSVYGGEEVTPPQYGRVIIAVDVENATGVSENNKTAYYNYLKDRCPIGIEPIIVSPEFMYISINSTVYYNTKITSQSTAAIRASVIDSILNYSDTNLSNFKKTFRHSKLSAAMDDADVSIISNNTEALAIIPLNPTVNVNNNFSFTFNNPLVVDHPLDIGEAVTTHNFAIKSSSFTYGGSNAFIVDNGSGILQIIRTTSSGFVYLNRNIGTVNYDTGAIVIRNLNVSAYPGSEIKMYGRTRMKDITSPKNRIVTIREEDINVTVVGLRE